MNEAPAASAWSSDASVVTVPAPTLPFSPMMLRASLMRSTAPSEFIVTSTLQRPPAIDAGTSFSTASRLKKRRIPTTGSLLNRSKLNVASMSGSPRKYPLQQDLLSQNAQHLRVDAPEPRAEPQCLRRRPVGRPQPLAGRDDDRHVGAAERRELGADEEAAQERRVRRDALPVEDLPRPHPEQRRGERPARRFLHPLEEGPAVERRRGIGGMAQHALPRQHVEELAGHVRPEDRDAAGIDVQVLRMGPRQHEHRLERHLPPQRRHQAEHLGLLAPENLGLAPEPRDQVDPILD